MYTVESNKRALRSAEAHFIMATYLLLTSAPHLPL
jgi:hypothetical protein